MNDHIRIVKSLEIPDVKVYESKNNQLSVVTKGTLEVIYVPEYDRFILRDNSFQYALSKDLPVMVSLFEQRAFRSYILPSLSGHYILKFKANPAPALIQSFEVMLSNYSQFSYKTGEEKVLKSQMIVTNPNAYQLNQENQPQRMNYKTPQNLEKGASYVSKAGEYLRHHIIRGANYIDKTMNATTTQTAILPRSLEEMKTVNPTGQSFDFSATGVLKLVSQSNDIQQAQATRTNNTYTQVEVLQPVSGQQGWNDLKQATTTSAKSMWGGMNEAATILSNAFAKKRKNKAATKPGVLQEKPLAKEFGDMKLVESQANYVPMTNTGTNQPVFGQNQPVYTEVQQTINDDYYAPHAQTVQPTYPVPQGQLYPQIDAAPGYNPNYYQKKTFGDTLKDIAHG